MEYSTDPVYWENKQGKYVVLVSTENPWYQNTEKTIPVPVIKPPADKFPKGYYRDNATFETADNKVAISYTQPDLGIEYFNQPKRHHINKLIYILIILIIIQLIYLYTRS